MSATKAVDLLIDQADWDQAADLATDAIRLLTVMNRRTLSRNDQQHVISSFAGLAAKACSLCLMAGRSVNDAVETLELGRGAILRLLIDDRRDISTLRELCPGEAHEYAALLTQVNLDLSEHNIEYSQHQENLQRVKSVKKLEDCIDRIRQVPGLERFLLGSSIHELQQQACEGPIIIVNVTSIRSDAIIVQTREVRVINLPAFSAAAVRRWIRKDLTKFDRNNYAKTNKIFRAMLLWTWESCVQEVVNALKKDASVDQAPLSATRVWWIGVGEASKIPFHAAGVHAPGSEENAFSHFISSYTPTIKALEFAREKLAAQVSRPDMESRRLCVVTMPQTPGKAELPGVQNEFLEIKKTAESVFHITHVLGPDSLRVKEHLKLCHIFHFAGHGESDPIDPFNGCLVLQKTGSSATSFDQDRLNVRDICQIHLPHAFLAYLSACSTAENSTTRLADEVLHLASGFEVAGFVHVVASLWVSDDSTCLEVARSFYQEICKNDSKITSDGVVARALQSSVVRVREQLLEEPLAWAQFVHVGA